MREPGRRTAAAGRRGLLGWSREDRGRVRLHRLVHVADVREHLVADLHERRRGVGSALRNRRDAGDRLTEIADHRIARLFSDRIAELRGLQLAIQHMHRTHSGIPLRREVSIEICAREERC